MATIRRTLTPNSQDIVARMDGGLTITTFVNILEENYWAGLPRSVNDDLRRFRMYTRFKPEIKMKYIYYYDKAENPSLDKSYLGEDGRRVAEKTEGGLPVVSGFEYVYAPGRSEENSRLETRGESFRTSVGKG